MSSNGRRVFSTVQLFSAKAATGVCPVQIVKDGHYIVVSVSATVNSTLTFKFQGSIQETAPDFGAAQSVTNIWDYVSSYDLNDPATLITGDAGVALNNTTVAANTRQFVINIDCLKWFSMEVSAWTDGALDAYMTYFND